MFKKVKKEIIFSNDTYKQQQINKPRMRSISNKDSVIKIRPFDFKYGFREYLRFSLSKVILRNDSGITFLPQTGSIVGEQSKCKALINKIMDEANRYKVKSVKFNDELDIDELEYWLDQDVKVYRPGVIEVALKNLQKNHLFLEECDDFRRKILDQNILLVRIPKEKVESTTEQIFKIVNEKQKQTSEISKSESSISSNLSLTQTNLNVTANISKDIQNGYSSTLNSQMQQQPQQKSYHITQKDQSIYNESFNIYYNRKGDNRRIIPQND